MRLFYIFSVMLIIISSIVITKQIYIENGIKQLQSQMNKIDQMVSLVYSTEFTRVIDKNHKRRFGRIQKVAQLEEVIMLLKE